MSSAHWRRWAIVVRGTVLIGVLLACCPAALALDPALDVVQYVHTAWRIRDGFLKALPQAIAQTRDGVLWLGTDAGVVRFDGVKFTVWTPPDGQELPSTNVQELRASRDGTLWIGTTSGLARWDGRRLIQYPRLNRSRIGRLLEDREGTLWTTVFINGKWALCQIRNGDAECYGQDGGVGAGAIALFEDRQARLWVGTSDGLWRWKPGPPTFFPLPHEVNGLQGLADADDGGLLVSSAGAIRKLVGGKTEMVLPLPAPERQAWPLFRDRDGGLWIATRTGGLLHLHQGVTDVFTSVDGLSANRISDLFEDLEGSIWVVTSEGVDRFRNPTVSTWSTRQGLSNSVAISLAAAEDGTVWVGTADGVNRIRSSEVAVYGRRPPSRIPPSGLLASRTGRDVAASALPDSGVQSMFRDSRGRLWVSTIRGVGYYEENRFRVARPLPGGATRAIAEDRRGFWVANQNAGLFRVSSDVDRFQLTPWTALGTDDLPAAMVADPQQGGVWVGFGQGGIKYVGDTGIGASFGSGEGLAPGYVRDLRFDPDGTLWIAADGGLSRLKGGRLATLTTRNGLPCDAIQWAMKDDDRSLWMGARCGLVRIAREDIERWEAAADSSTASTRPVRHALFDVTEGAQLMTFSAYTSPVAKSTDGRLWFVTVDGLGIVDPRRLPFNKVPPPVFIEQITAGGITYGAATSSGTRLPALTRDLQIDYTALSFVAPEKVRFRYKLEGFDAEWQDAGNRRQAFYTNLPPRDYRFRVIAANNSGVWNETGAALEFSIAPAYYQTTWFRLSMLGTVLLVLAALYRLRVMYLAHRFNLRIEERVNERTRIARELHDTMLQSFQGALLKFHAVTFQIADRPEAKRALEKVIAQATQAISEGRDAVQGLRSSTVAGSDLARALSVLGEELARDHSERTPPACSVQVEGTPRTLAALVHDDVYRIGAEALRNAFRHAEAQRIEIEIRYGHRVFRLRVRDDGKGIDPAVLAEGGRDGHYGLAGMHERAALIKGKLAIWSERDSGTETELIVPASIAYPKE